MTDEAGSAEDPGERFRRENEALRAENARLRAAPDRLRALAEATNAIVQAPDLAATLGAIADAARDLVGARRAGTSLLPGEAPTPDETVPRQGSEDPILGAGIEAWLRERGGTGRMTGAELEAHPAWTGRETPGEAPPRGWLGAALTGRDGRALGLIEIADKAEGAFDEADEAVVAQLARFAASAIERTQADEARRRSEATLSAVLDALPVGVIIADASGRILRDNAANRELWGIPPETGSWEGYSDWVGFWPETGERIKAHDWAMARALLRGETVRGELVENRRFGTGERRFYLNSAAPVRDEAGRIVAGVVAELDVTDRLAVERALRESEERYRELADNMSQFAWTADAGGAIYWYNKRWFDYTGTTLEDMRGWGWTKVHHPDHVDRVVSRIGAAFRTGEPWEDTFPLRGRDGSYRWFLSRALPIRDESGQVVRWFGTNTDITRQREAEEAALHASELLRLISDATPDMIYAKDRDSRVLYANAAVQRVIGRPLDEILGRNDFAWAWDRRQAEIIVAHDRRVIETGDTLDVDETYTGPDGRTTHFRSLKAPLRDRSGAIIGLVGITSDVTERRNAEERERLLAREVDHRAKNLLAVVQSVVQLTRADGPTEFKAAVRGRIQSLARTHGLLAASRWEGADLKDLIADELKPFDREGERAPVSGPALRLKPAAAQSLALVMHELATNAAKHGALSVPTGRVEVTWALDETDGRLSLRWAERGGPPVAPPTRRGFGSTVLRASIEGQLQGAVAMDWSPEGLTCTLSVPADQIVAAEGGALATAATPRDTRHARSGLGGRTVLVVEDEALIAVELGGLLEAAGCTVLGPAARVAEAFDLIYEGRPDAALLDVNVAGERSFALAEVLASKGVPFAFCSGYGEGAVLPEGMEAVPVIPKPFDAAEVRRILDRLVS